MAPAEVLCGDGDDLSNPLKTQVRASGDKQSMSKLPAMVRNGCVMGQTKEGVR